MQPSEQVSFDRLYKKHLRALRLQGLSDKTIDVYSRAVRRAAERFDCCPSQLTREQLAHHFEQLVDSHSWSTVKVDRNGLQFFWKHVLQRDWQWVEIIKAPKIKTLPDILTVGEVEQVIGAARRLRYRVFVLTTYSMGLRLGETLALQVGDIDAARQRVHVRRGKGHKDRFVPLPDLTLRALRALWGKHRHRTLLFPNTLGADAIASMDRGGTQNAVKKMVEDCGIKKKSPSIRFVIASPLIFSNAA